VQTDLGLSLCCLAPWIFIYCMLSDQLLQTDLMCLMSPACAHFLALHHWALHHLTRPRPNPACVLLCREKDSDVADRVVSGVVIMFQSLAKLVSLSHPKVAQLMDTIQSALAPASKTA
jgi:hypothetical protein